MATKTFEELKQMAIQIRDEKANKQNTATRIGTQMVEHLNKLEQDFLDKDTTEGKFTELEESTNTKFSELEKSNSNFTGRLFEQNENIAVFDSNYGYVKGGIKGTPFTSAILMETTNKSYHVCSTIIPIKPGVEYSYTGQVEAAAYAVGWFDEDLNLIKAEGKNINIDSGGITFTSPSNAYYAVVCSTTRNDIHKRASFKPLTSYWFTIYYDNIIKKLCQLENGKLDKEYIFNDKFLSKKSSIYATEQEKIDSILNFDFYSSEIINKKWILTTIGYYNVNHIVAIQGYVSDNNEESTNNVQWTIILDKVDSKPIGIKKYTAESIFNIDELEVNIGTEITIDFDKLEGFDTLYCTLKPISYDDYKKNTKILEEELSAPDYPYPINLENTFKALPSSILKSNNVTINLISNNDFIESNVIEVTIGTPLPDTSRWNYFYSINKGTYKKGKYLAFIKAKRIGTSSINLQVFSDGGESISKLYITNLIDDDYQIFSIPVKLEEDKKIYVGVSAEYSYNHVVSGDKIYLSLIGFAQDRSGKSIGSDIYTIDDLKNYFLKNLSLSSVTDAAINAIIQGIPSIGIIGDSLSSGATYNHYDKVNPLQDREGCEWWRVLERESGAKYLDFAKGGLTTRSWLTTFLNKATQEENRCCAYIIGLGVNDAYSLGEPYLGSSSDIDIANPDNNKDTYYGNYAKIIQKLTMFNNRAKFFVMTEPRKNGDLDEKWNGAVRYIANLFDNVYLVDLQKLYHQEWTTGFIASTIGPQAHYPYITYCYIAKLIEKAIGDVIIKNARGFVDIQFASEME